MDLDSKRIGLPPILLSSFALLIAVVGDIGSWLEKLVAEGRGGFQAVA